MQKIIDAELKWSDTQQKKSLSLLYPKICFSYYISWNEQEVSEKLYIS
jgi:hypothetical protein